MKIITEKDLPVKTTFGDFNKLDPSKVLYGLQGLTPGSDILDKGVKFVERKIFKISQILFRLEDNPYRYDGKDEPHCNSLGKFIETMGIDYSQPPPIIEYFPEGHRDLASGKVYFYLCYSGAQRSEAFLDKNIHEWIFDVYSYDSDKARQGHIAKINGSHPPALVASTMSAINHTTKMIHEEQLDQKDLPQYIADTYPAIPDHNSIISAIERKFTYRDEAIFTSKDVERFLEKEGLGVGGKVINGNAHYACKEGYEDRRSIQALLKWAETNVFSHLYVYVNGSTNKESISEKRWKVHDRFKEIEAGWLKLFKMWKATGTVIWPWEIKAFLAQKNKEGETGLLTYDEIEPRK